MLHKNPTSFQRYFTSSLIISNLCDQTIELKSDPFQKLHDFGKKKII